MGMADRGSVFPHVGLRATHTHPGGQMKIALLLFACFAAGCLLAACVSAEW